MSETIREEELGSLELRHQDCPDDCYELKLIASYRGLESELASVKEKLTRAIVDRDMEFWRKYADDAAKALNASNAKLTKNWIDAGRELESVKEKLQHEDEMFDRLEAVAQQAMDKATDLSKRLAEAEQQLQQLQTEKSVTEKRLK